MTVGRGARAPIIGSLVRGLQEVFMRRPKMIGPVFLSLFVFNPAFFTGCGADDEEFA